MLLLPENKRNSPKALGISKNKLEENFDKKMAIIYPTHSPVNMLGGQPNTKAPRPLGTSVFRKLSKIIMERLSPLINVKKDMDDVYSKGYFENHYPKLDGKLKTLLHEQAIASWSHAENEEIEENINEEIEENNNSSISVTINIK